MKIELLADNVKLIPEIAELKFQEFGYLLPDKTLENFRLGLETHLNDQLLPIAYVVTDSKKFVGTFSLRKYDLHSYTHLTPWLGSVLVHPDKRKQGIGSFLVQQAEEIAKEMGYSSLYLFTPNKAAWYSQLGWRQVEETVFNNFPVTLMTKKLKHQLISP